MIYGTKYGRIRFPGGLMEYVRFGTGQRHLILLPGLGESLRSLKGMALPMAVLYRAFAADFPEAVEKLVLTVTCPAPIPFWRRPWAIGKTAPAGVTTRHLWRAMCA